MRDTHEGDSLFRYITLSENESKRTGYAEHFADSSRNGGVLLYFDPLSEGERIEPYERSKELTFLGIGTEVRKYARQTGWASAEADITISQTVFDGQQQLHWLSGMVNVVGTFPGAAAADASNSATRGLTQTERPRLKLASSLRVKIFPPEEKQIVGRIALPDDFRFGTTTGGDIAHERIGLWLRDQFSDMGIEGFIIRSGKGQKLVDVEVPDEFVAQLGFKTLEIKPNSSSGVKTLNAQQGKWLDNGHYDLDQMAVLTYDAKGNLRWGFDIK